MAKRFGLTVRSARPGLLLLANGELLCKTEYGDNEGNLDVFIVSSGERYWGTDIGGLNALVVDVTDAVSDYVRDVYELGDDTPAGGGE